MSTTAKELIEEGYKIWRRGDESPFICDCLGVAADSFDAVRDNDDNVSAYEPLVDVYEWVKAQIDGHFGVDRLIAVRHFGFEGNSWEWEGETKKAFYELDSNAEFKQLVHEFREDLWSKMFTIWC